MTQSNFRTILGFTLFGMLAGPFVTSAGFVMWLVSTVIGLALGSVFYALGAFVLSRNVALLSRLGFLLLGLVLGAAIGALIGSGFHTARVTIDLPAGMLSAFACAALTLIAWVIIRLAFGQSSFQTTFQPRLSFAFAMLFTWIGGLLGSLFYPLYASILDAVGFGAIVGGFTGAFLGLSL
ncbi:MAG: hypothetical protein N2559_08040, partial [Anaerolineae bacterium]|nr:hypothetical protein [Anaerolineae bacterium]